MAKLYQRRVLVDVGVDGSGKRLEGLDVSFHVKMVEGSAPNEATIEVINASRDTVGKLQEEGAIIRLLAGYQTPRQVFVGNPVHGGVTFKSVPPDTRLTVVATDGGREWGLGQVAESFETATTAAQVWKALTDALGLPVSQADLDTALDFPNGWAFVGRAADALDSFAASIGREWFIRDGVVFLVDPTKDTGERAVSFSTRTGNLIGAPEQTKEGMRVTGLLAPTLRPGKPFNVESANTNGLFRATVVEFIGTSGPAASFYTIATGRPL